MAIQIHRTVDLTKVVQPEPLAGMTFTGESGGHEFILSAKDGELNGGVTARFLRADGSTKSLTGSTSEGKAHLTLTADCYEVTGRFLLTIFYSDGSGKSAIYAAVGNVMASSKGSITPSQAAADTFEEILAGYVTQMTSATSAANTAAGAATDAAAAANTAATNITSQVAADHSTLVGQGFRMTANEIGWEPQRIGSNDTIATSANPIESHTDYIPILPGQRLYFKTHLATYAYCFIYDAEKNPIERYHPESGTSKDAYEVDTVVPGNAVYLRLSCADNQLADTEIIVYGAVDAVQSLTIRAEASGNVLYGKKWFATGDSFTAGDFSGWTDSQGRSGTSSPEIYDSSWAMYKTYPWWIAKRNGMTLINDAVAGSTMALSKEYIDGEQEIGYRSPFSYQRYQSIPADVDYITLWFGINDAAHANLGTIDDNTNETFYGAWNIVMRWILTNRPNAHVGIIVTNTNSDGQIYADYRQATRDVARKWGVAYLDMMGDDKVPLVIGGRDGADVCAEAISLRNSAFWVTSENHHPNLQAHKYESTFIENFLRRI